MKKFKKLLILNTILILNLFLCLNVYGATKQSYTATLTGSSTAEKNKEITLAFNATNLGSLANGFAGYSGKINFDNTKLQFVSATNVVSGWVINTAKNSDTRITFLGYDDMTPANTVYGDTKICNITFKVLPDATGSTTVTIDTIKGTTSAGESLIADDVSKTITITSPADPQPKSSDATLKGLSTSAGLSPSFSPTRDSYTVTVPNGTTSIDVSALVNDSKASVSISGNTNLSVGKNNVLVQVTAEDGSKKIYKIEVTRSAPTSGGTTTPPTSNPKPSTPTSSKSSNNRLKSISGIDGLPFDPNRTNYDIEVPFDTTSINVKAVPEDSKSTCTISNGSLTNLKVGETQTVNITVKAEDGSIKVYTINVKRSPYKSETDLEKLLVNNKNIIKDGKDEYSITVSSGTKSIDINAIPKDKDTKVTIIGNTNLKSGNNKVIVQVKDKNGFTKNYILNVNRQKEISFFKFIDKYWYLFLILPIIILLILLYFYNKNRKYLAALDDEEEEMEHKLVNYSPTNIDNKVYISYNSNNNIGFEDRDNIDDIQSNITKYLNDDSIPEIERTVNFVKQGVDDDREYEIKEKIRKK